MDTSVADDSLPPSTEVTSLSSSSNVTVTTTVSDKDVISTATSSVDGATAPDSSSPLNTGKCPIEDITPLVDSPNFKADNVG